MTLQNGDPERLPNLTVIQEQFENASIQYQNLKDRQSLRTLGLLSGVLLCLIGLILGQTWPIRILVFVLGLLILSGTAYGIARVSQVELEQKETVVMSLREQLDKKQHLEK
jgi:hypothetical protein